MPAGEPERAAAFVVPCVRDAFAAGLGAWVRSLLERIIRALGKTGDFSGNGQAALQWWIFVNANFHVICKDVNSFVAVARQWDVHGIVYESLFGRVKEISSDSGGKSKLAAVAAAAASAAAKPFASVTSAASSYLQHPLRHTFPTVSYNQRCRFSFAHEASCLSTFRYGSHVSMICDI